MGRVPPLVTVEERTVFAPDETVVFPLIVIAGFTMDVIVIAIPGDVAVVGLAHAIEEVITTVTTSPLANALFEYVLLFVPALFPLSFH